MLTEPQPQGHGRPGYPWSRRTGADRGSTRGLPYMAASCATFSTPPAVAGIVPPYWRYAGRQTEQGLLADRSLYTKTRHCHLTRRDSRNWSRCEREILSPPTPQVERSHPSRSTSFKHVPNSEVFSNRAPLTEAPVRSAPEREVFRSFARVSVARLRMAPFNPHRSRRAI